MSLWTMIAIIVALGVISEMYRARLKAQTTWAQMKDQEENILSRLDRMEERLRNLETLVLENEKDRAFHDALNNSKE